MSANMTVDIRPLPLAALQLSQTPAQKERRAHFDKAKLGELAESLKTVGLLQPIVVRPSPFREVDEELFEVVAGERRLQASKIAGLEEILASVRDLDDHQVAKIQLIENLQREDVHPLAEAEGYDELLKLHGYSIEQLAAEVGKSKAYVYARLKLLALEPAQRKAFYDGKLTASTALLIARIPSALQKEALTEITKLQGWGDHREPMSARQAQKFIHDNFMLRLSDAGFKSGDATLLPSAGACGPCPKRTGNQPELFGDVKGADVCTDPLCFKQKVKAHAERVLAAAKETGQRVLVGNEAKKVARYGADSSLEGFVRLDARDHDRKGTFRQTLGKDYAPTLLQEPESGKMIEVAPNKDVDKAHGDSKRSRGGDTDSHSAKQRAAERKHRFEISYRVALFKAVHDADSSRKTLSRREMDTVADRLLTRLDHDSKKRLFSALGWEAKKRRGSSGVDLNPPMPIEQMSDEAAAQLVRDCSLAHELQVWQHNGETRPKDLEAAAAALDVDAKKIRRELEQAAQKKAAKGKKPAPAKATKKKAR